jgi:hypothetical protein
MFKQISITLVFFTAFSNSFSQKTFEGLMVIMNIEESSIKKK